MPYPLDRITGPMNQKRNKPITIPNVEVRQFRNFIIDPDLNHWPEATSYSIEPGGGESLYTSAMWRYIDYNDNLNQLELDITRETDVPTQAESGNESNHSIKFEVISGQGPMNNRSANFEYDITGYDYSNIFGNTFTFSFWHKHSFTTAPTRRAFGYFQSIGGGGGGTYRSYVFEYSQNTADVWEKSTITVEWSVLGLTGTQNFTDDVGLRVGICLGCGNGFEGGENNLNTWVNARIFGIAATNDFIQGAGRIMRFAQFGFYSGPTTAAFVAPPTADVSRQVEYYIQTSDFTTGDIIRTSNQVLDEMWADFWLRRTMRVTPAIDFPALADLFFVYADGSTLDTETPSGTSPQATTNQYRIQQYFKTAGEADSVAYLRVDDTAASVKFIFDSRHYTL